MDDHASDGHLPSLTPLDFLPLIEDAFFSHLWEQPLDLPSDVRRDLPARIRAAAADLTAKTGHLMANELDRGNVGFALFAVAAYEALLVQVGPERAIALVDACLNEPMQAWVFEVTRAMLDGAPDPFRALVEACRQREVDYFGPSFQFERPVDDDHGYLLNIRRCVFHEALSACGRRELQPVMCRFDLSWIDAIDPRKHGLRFERPSTFVDPDVDACRMWFIRTDGLVSLRLEPAGSEADAAPHR